MFKIIGVICLIGLVVIGFLYLIGMNALRINGIDIK